MKTEYSTRASSASLMRDVVLLLQSNDPENAQVMEMLTKAKRNYVKERHPRMISQIHSKSKYKDGKWKTYVYVDEKRKVVEANTEEELYTWLYDFYKAQDDAEKTFEEVFLMLEDKKRRDGRTDQTLREDKRHFNFLSEEIRNKAITEITEDELRDWLYTDYMPERPKQEALKKTLQLIRAVFDFGREKKLCRENPAEFIKYTDYASQCDLNIKTHEEKSFSEEETAKLREYALSDQSNPHSVAMLFAMATGMRAGEIASLKKKDIVDGYLHVHSQQRTDRSSGHQQHVDLGFTKDQRQRPRDGRYFPITPACEEALRIAENLPGESEYILHNKNGRAILKGSYMQHLRRVCKSLGIKITNNHAFRVALNAQLINENIDGLERCLILGHSMQTNERHYSYSDQRRLESIKKKLTSTN